MRFKPVVIQKIDQVDALINRTALEINRNYGQETILETLETLKEKLAELRELVSIEHDDFVNQ